jgi:hypothetical protein
MTEGRKSSRCSDSACVEVFFTGDGGVQVGNSKDPDGVRLTYTRAEWEAFIAGAKDGEFDL